MSSFGIYLTGFLILIAGLAYAAVVLHAPPVWIAIGVLILVGIGIISGVSRTRRPDPPVR